MDVAARPSTPVSAVCLSVGVYAFGFLFMLPQLFVNYKVRRPMPPAAPSPVPPAAPSPMPPAADLCLSLLFQLKSVAHLPWKAFTYKAFNTFIDDVFAFIITMPTSHRLACFRDDVVFLVYLYQRW
ncbi:Cleft lip and palate associated transmembrane protein 1 [Saguinus oedipus]|uniref:Lipid scramblase CLPTM1L n=1 Tax=Saguinus oedipus TaxID=9490 RepID=A0ABQ9W782_SAGOE|nr:Cleft lip and palate associated transmembrane protein 1 [Saguinus oedipus]